MVLPFNTFTLHNLLGLLVSAALGVTFLVIYLKFGRRKLDLIAAGFVLCSAGMCGASFLTDNLVPAGMSSYGWHDGPTAQALAQSTMQIHRVQWAFALIGMLLQFHFVLCYCGRHQAIRRHIRILYFAILAIIPLIWTSFWMEIRTEPLAQTSSWSIAIPWIPIIGSPFPTLPFMLVWYTVVIYSVVMLIQNVRRPAAVSSEYSGQEFLIMLAFLAQMIVVMVDLLFVLFEYNGISVTPPASMIRSVFLAVAFFRARVASEESKLRLEREKVGWLQTVNIKLWTAREEERHHLAKELHDSVAQSLLAMHMTFRAQAMKLNGDSRAREEVERLAGCCKDLIQEIRGICHGLYPATLDLLGLVPAMSKLLSYCEAAGKKAEFHHSDQMAGTRFSPEVEIAIFRVCQEGVNNAVRHSQAEKVEIYLDHDGQKLSLSIVDNGIGFDLDDLSRRGLGMTTMRERISGIGGQLTVSSRRGRTRIDAQISCSPRSSSSS